MYDFGDRASGRIVDPLTFHATKPARYAAGTVVQIFPHAKNVVGIAYTNGETVVIKVTR